jgi:hypothetical protein
MQQREQRCVHQPGDSQHEADQAHRQRAAGPISIRAAETVNAGGKYLILALLKSVLFPQ